MKLIFPTYGDISTNLSKTVHENSDLSVTSNNNLFSKIMLPVIPSTLKSNQFVSYEYRPFEDVLDNISSIIIQFLDSDGKIIDMNTEHNFTLKIVERQNVLKNTLLNTRTNQINTTGIIDKC